MKLLKFFGMVSLGNRILRYEMSKGYQEYRDFARQELQDGYERNPAISGLAEVGGALASPIKPFNAKDIINMIDKAYHSTIKTQKRSLSPLTTKKADNNFVGLFCTYK